MEWVGPNHMSNFLGQLSPKLTLKKNYKTNQPQVHFNTIDQGMFLFFYFVLAHIGSLTKLHIRFEITNEMFALG